MPTVRKLRPSRPWPAVAAPVSQTTGAEWTVKRLRNSVRRLAAEGLVDRKIMGRSPLPRRRRSDELAVLVQARHLEVVCKGGPHGEQDQDKHDGMRRAPHRHRSAMGGPTAGRACPHGVTLRR